MAKEVQAHGYDLTVFKVRWGNLTLKIYDKGGRVLRVEVVVHNAKELRCGKVLQKLPALGQLPVGSTPEQFEIQFRADITKFEKVVRDARLPPQD